MDKERTIRRDRLVAASLVGILLVLLYGPGAAWFVQADRVLYDQLATRVANAPLENGMIVTIDPDRVAPGKLDAVYGAIIQKLKLAGVARIVLPGPPPIEPGAELPGWAATLATGSPVFVPRGHRLDRVASWSGFLNVEPDDDGVLRRASLWQFEGGVMFPSLPLAIALQNPRYAGTKEPIPGTDAAVCLTNYAELPRISAIALLEPDFDTASLAGRTVFVDTDAPLVAAVATLPSGQYVTRSELTAALLAGIEQQQAVTAPLPVIVLQWLAPVLLGIGAVLWMPGRRRRDVVLATLAAILVLVVLEALLLAFGRLRLDLGRPVLIVASVGILCWWFATSGKKAAVNAFKRGTDFLAAGRLEPAFAEFRRCEPTETLAAVMYKLSLAFEEQAKPERAEAVLQWMKRTQEPPPPREKRSLSLSDSNGMPQRLGRYVIERRIGRGAMGAVYLARDPRINRPVALKVIPIEKEFEDEELEEARLRFFREAESAGRLTHPNIITVYDAGEDKHLAYIAMEYLTGQQLTHFTDPKRLLAPKKALELCARTAEALDYAHNQQVIHRDIKPANLMWDNRADILKITDFGVARLTDNNRTKTGIVLGTPMYMSPEQLAAEPLTGHSDLFSLGVTLYELLAGEVPFKATNIAVLMTKITSEDPVPVSRRRPGIPPSVDAVLSKALAKRPEDRFANGGEMAIALRNCARYAA
ncbi:MAG TPA: protein kinase [Woeseiaceae bacterium]|nr:protein kinase [Woeseiaceae bacterium]